MFDVGWSEMLVIAAVAVLAVGPKDLPRMLRTIGKSVSTVRRMAGDFQRQFDQALREAELDEVRKEMKKPFQPLEDARKSALDFQRQMNQSASSIERDLAKPAAAAGEEPAPIAPPPADAAPAPASAAVANGAAAPVAPAQPAAPAAENRG